MYIAYDEIFWALFKVLKGIEANEATFNMVFKVPHLKKVTKFMVIYKLIYPLSPIYDQSCENRMAGSRKIRV